MFGEKQAVPFWLDLGKSRRPEHRHRPELFRGGIYFNLLSKMGPCEGFRKQFLCDLSSTLESCLSTSVWPGEPGGASCPVRREQESGGPQETVDSG